MINKKEYQSLMKDLGPPKVVVKSVVLCYKSIDD